MPLPPNASITDVINKLSELEGINQKTELASVIGSPALSTDTVAQQIVKLQDSKDLLATTLTNKDIPTVNTESINDMVLKVDFLGGFASGTATSGSLISVKYINGATTTKNAITISGLSFKPTRIELYYKLGTSSYVTEYRNDFFGYTDSVVMYIVTESSQNETSFHIRGNDDDVYVNNTGFRLPVITGAGITYQWKAYK